MNERGRDSNREREKKERDEHEEHDLQNENGKRNRAGERKREMYREEEEGDFKQKRVGETKTTCGCEGQQRSSWLLLLLLLSYQRVAFSFP